MRDFEINIKSSTARLFSAHFFALVSQAMAAPLLRALPLLRLCRAHRSYHLSLINAPTHLRPLCTSAADSTGGGGDDKSSSLAQIYQSTNIKDRPHFPKWDDPDFRKWKIKEAEIFEDIEPIVCLTKEILHSNRWNLSLSELSLNCFNSLLFVFIFCAFLFGDGRKIHFLY